MKRAFVHNSTYWCRTCGCYPLWEPDHQKDAWDCEDCGANDPPAQIIKRTPTISEEWAEEVAFLHGADAQGEGEE